MSKAAFPLNDLLRRKLQTSLTVATLTLSVASTLFLLLFSRRIGWGITSISDTLTYGLSTVFSQFMLFIGVLIFTVGAVITSFIVFLMMKQRTRDFGLIKAAGCPNGLVFGYFMTELFMITFLGCVLGIVLGFVADFAVTGMFPFQAYQKTADLWLAPLVFAVFSGLALIFGAKPMLDAARLSPIKALSAVQYFGLTTRNKFKPLSRFGLTLRIASRSLFRRQSASVRIVILLSIVFVMLTVAISGGVIANNTSRAWIENAVGKNVVAIAHKSMINHYTQLLTKFAGATEKDDFNYLDAELAVSDTLLQQLYSMPEIEIVDPRLIMKAHTQEVSNFTIDPVTLTTLPVGDNREAESLIVGVDPQNVTSSWLIKGRFLNATKTDEAIIGDSISQMMFSPDLHEGITLSDPLVQGIKLQNGSFSIVGVCVDPINNGKVIYVSIEKLQNLTGVSTANILLVKLDQSAERSSIFAKITNEISSVNSGFSVFELNEVLQENLDFLGSAWSTVMLLPLFTLMSAALCLIGYTMLAVEVQRREFAVLLAVGVKSETVIAVLGIQSVIVLLSSFAVGISLGVITTLMILMPHPVVTSFTVFEITAWLFAALAGMFLLSLWPALKIVKKPILRTIS